MSAVLDQRSRGYGRRSAQLGHSLSLPEAADARAPGREILIATSKLDGEVLGSLRLNINLEGPTAVERAADLPEIYAGKRLMDASRFCCLSGGAMCRSTLFKASLQYAKAHGVDYFVLATLPKIEPLYASVGFAPIYEDGRLHPIAMAQNAPHRLMSMDIEHAREQVARLRPTMVDFLFDTDHGDDIDISDALALMDRKA